MGNLYGMLGDNGCLTMDLDTTSECCNSGSDKESAGNTPEHSKYVYYIMYTYVYTYIYIYMYLFIYTLVCNMCMISLGVGRRSPDDSFPAPLPQRQAEGWI